MNDDPRQPDGAKKEAVDALQDRLDALADNVGAAGDKARGELDDLDQDFDEKLSTIDQRMQQARKDDNSRKLKSEKGNIVDRSTGRGLAVGMTVAYAIAGTPVAGWAIGWFIDKQVGGTAWQGWLCLIGAVAGVAFAIVFLNKHQK